jgi:hypothetical protein
MKHAWPIAIALAVLVAAGTGGYALASDDPEPAVTTTEPAPVRPIEAFAVFVTRSPAAAVSHIADDIARHTGSQPGIPPRLLPGDSAQPVYAMVGDEEVCFFHTYRGKLSSYGCTPTKRLARLDQPVIFLDRADDETIVLTTLRPSDVSSVTVVTAAGATIEVDVVDGVASTRLPDRPASVTSTTSDGRSHTFTYDLAEPLEMILPPTKAELAKMVAAEAAEVAASADTAP